jgi:acyl-CoA thioester hydrolase
MLKCDCKVVVRFNEADPLGIVWHGHYLRYFEDAREAFGKKYGFAYLDFHSAGFAVPIVTAHLDYKKPSRFGDELVVECEFIPQAAAKIHFSYKIFEVNNPTQILASGYTVQVFVSLPAFELQWDNPEFFKQWKIKHNIWV